MVGVVVGGGGIGEVSEKVSGEVGATSCVSERVG